MKENLFLYMNVLSERQFLSAVIEAREREDSIEGCYFSCFIGLERFIHTCMCQNTRLCKQPCKQ